MSIKLENVGIAVRDLEATIAFFIDLGLSVLGRDTVSGEWTDTAVGLDVNHANIAMLQTPDGIGRLELFEYIHPDAIETEPTLPNEIGIHRVAFWVVGVQDGEENPGGDAEHVQTVLEATPNLRRPTARLPLVAGDGEHS